MGLKRGDVGKEVDSRDVLDGRTRALRRMRMMQRVSNGRGGVCTEPVIDWR